MRAILDKYLSTPAASYTGLDMDAWKEELKFILDRLAKTATTKSESSQKDRKWKREDLYDRWRAVLCSK